VLAEQELLGKEVTAAQDSLVEAVAVAVEKRKLAVPTLIKLVEMAEPT
jgi:hypothetical protein